MSCLNYSKFQTSASSMVFADWLPLVRCRVRAAMPLSEPVTLIHETRAETSSLKKLYSTSLVLSVAKATLLLHGGVIQYRDGLGRGFHSIFEDGGASRCTRESAFPLLNLWFSHTQCSSSQHARKFSDIVHADVEGSAQGNQRNSACAYAFDLRDIESLNTPARERTLPSTSPRFILHHHVFRLR